MSAEMSISDDRLAKIATQGASAQPWEIRAIASECLAHRVLSNNAMVKRPTLLQPEPPAAKPAFVGTPAAES